LNNVGHPHACDCDDGARVPGVAAGADGMVEVHPTKPSATATAASAHSLDGRSSGAVGPAPP
jgi:hypothetical protein